MGLAGVVLILTLHSRYYDGGASVTPVEMLNMQSCQAAGQTWVSSVKKTAGKSYLASYVCVRR